MPDSTIEPPGPDDIAIRAAVETIAHAVAPADTAPTPMIDPSRFAELVKARNDARAMREAAKNNIEMAKDNYRLFDDSVRKLNIELDKYIHECTGDPYIPPFEY